MQQRAETKTGSPAVSGIPFHSSSLAALRALARWAGAVVALGGLLVLVGWVFDLATLKSVFSGLVSMKANTALCFLLAGLSLRVLAGEAAMQGTFRLAQGGAVAVVLIVALTLGEYLCGWELGLDQLLFSDSSLPFPGRMAPATALNFLLVGIGLLVLDRRPLLAQALALVAALVPLIALTRYLYGASALYGIGSYTSMALHTALGFLLLCAGVLAARPEWSFAAILVSDTLGGKVVWRLFPAVVLMPLGLGWLRLQGERQGFYETEFGLALFAVANVVVLAALVWWSSRWLQEAEKARAQAERALEEHRTMTVRTDRLRFLGQMAAGMAHELNQPLQGVRGQAEHLLIGMERGWKVQKTQLREKLQSIIAQADRMAHIIEHLRVFAREAGQPTRRLVQVGEVIRAAASLLAAQFRSRGIEMEFDLAPDLPLVSANPFSLEEVILNLLTNARDAVEERGQTGLAPLPPQIVVRAWAEGEGTEQRVRIEVLDQGVGIPEAILAQVFDPFFTTKSPDRGTGLGLSIVKSLVEEIGGCIAIQSTVGEGTQVSLSLPAASPQKER